MPTMVPRSGRRTYTALACVALVAGCGGGSSSSSGAQAPPPGGAGPVIGLDARPANLTCIAPASPAPAASEIALEPAFAGLSFEQPLGMLQAPGDDGRWFVLEKGGTVRTFVNDAGVAAFDADFIRLTVNADGEGGLLGMAFHPD